MFASMSAVRFTSSKTLFLLVVGAQAAVLAGCAGAFSGKSDLEKFKDRQKNFSSVISSAGGTASLGDQSMGIFKMNGWVINLSGGKLTDATIERMIEAARGAPVLDLNLSRTGVTDEQLGKLNKGGVLMKTVNLDLSETKISDAGLDQIDAAAAITHLNLKGSSATKAGAQRLGKRKIANPSTPAMLKKQPEVTI